MEKKAPWLGFAVDVWALGITAYCVICGKHPFEIESEKQMYQDIMFVDPDFGEPEWKEVSDDCKDFIM